MAGEAFLPLSTAMSIPFLRCMALVASFYGLPPRALPAIQAVEGGAPGIVHVNANGTDDLGVMQVNTLWIEPLARITHLTPQAVQARLVADACFNIAAAGAILRAYLGQTHDLMTAIGDYHSHTPLLNQQYQREVLAAARRLFVMTRR
ncbi:MAG TPA: lytic transglycosylase domain-containing protein [Acetobacteraceae bacterium]|nr:lytic transglycosylase domain-containing protein [Acetobacteraceae bacterium]